MKIVIAPDSFKESLSATEVAASIAAGFREIFPEAEYVLSPVADGGEGTVEAMVAATGGRYEGVEVTGPLGEPVSALYGITGDGRTAVIEMAAAAGLALVPRHLRNPLLTTTYGAGELVRAALDLGMRRFIVGIGGSATNDGGAGMLQALGVRLLDAKGEELPRGGGALAGLARLDLREIDPRLKECSIEVACDVDNPLTGPRGASAVFGPQKGATPGMVAQLDIALARYAGVIAADAGMDVASVPGSGAAGGMGAGMLLLGARLRPGIEIVMEAVGLEESVRGATLVVTGEGRLDAQTAGGKAVQGVARLGRKHGRPVVVIAGSVAADIDLDACGVAAALSILHEICSLEEALADAAANLRMSARNVAAVFRTGMGAGR